jgi:hypothetical protein
MGVLPVKLKIRLAKMQLAPSNILILAFDDYSSKLAGEKTFASRLEATKN